MSPPARSGGRAWWAHFEFTRINIGPTILRKKIEDLRKGAPCRCKDLVKAGTATSITDAQFKIARLYGFPSWPNLKAHVESLEKVGQLRQAIDRNDIERVKTSMTRNPTLHRAPIGYGKDGPLTWVAECRVPWESPTPTRLSMAKWMIENGSDVHQGGDGPLMRAALNGYRIPMMELLVSCGADVNAEWHGDFPIIFAPCEALDPEAFKWLLDRGANPNCGNARGRGTALDYVIETYARSPARLAACIDLLIDAGGTTKYSAPGVLANGLRTVRRPSITWPS